MRPGVVIESGVLLCNTNSVAMIKLSSRRRFSRKANWGGNFLNFEQLQDKDQQQRMYDSYLADGIKGEERYGLQSIDLSASRAS